jgi:hypothetical protein
MIEIIPTIQSARHFCRERMASGDGGGAGALGGGCGSMVIRFSATLPNLQQASQEKKGTANPTNLANHQKENLVFFIRWIRQIRGAFIFSDSLEKWTRITVPAKQWRAACLPKQDARGP